MPDLQKNLTRKVRDKLVDVIADQPGTAWVDYNGITRKVTEHGKLSMITRPTKKFILKIRVHRLYERGIGRAGPLLF